jgi:hypothetical protein
LGEESERHPAFLKEYTTDVVSAHTRASGGNRTH